MAIAELVTAAVAALIAIMKGFFGIDKPQEVTVYHPEPVITVDERNHVEERLADLGL